MIQSSLRGNGPRGAFLVSYGMGVVADQVFYVALSWYALAATDSDIATGAIVSLGALPRALLLLPGGMLADRLGHRVSSVISGLVRAAVLAVAAALCGASGPSVAALSAMAVAFGAIEALYLPGTQSIVADVAAPDELERTQGLFSAVQKAGTVLAPALAGWAVRVLEPRTLLWCVCLIALASSLTLAVGPRREEAVGGPVPQVSTRAALGGILRDPVIARCLALILVAEFAAAGITGTGYALLSAQKGWDAAQMGSVLSLYGAGAAVSALAVAAARPRRTSAWIGSSTAVCGVAFAVSGVSGLPAARFAALVAGRRRLLDPALGDLSVTHQRRAGCDRALGHEPGGLRNYIALIRAVWCSVVQHDALGRVCRLWLRARRKRPCILEVDRDPRSRHPPIGECNSVAHPPCDDEMGYSLHL